MTDVIKFKEKTLKLKEWLLEMLRKHRKGWPAVVETDNIGAWTSADGLRVFLNDDSLEDELFIPVVQEILDKQLKGGNWSLIRGQEGSSISTGEALQALIVAKKRYSHLPICKRIDDAIVDGSNWLILSKNKDGGWGLERSIGIEGKSRAFCTAYALLGLSSINNDQARDAIKDGINFLSSCCNTKDGLWGKVPGDETNAAVSSAVAYSLFKVNADNFKAELVLKKLEAKASESNNILSSLMVDEEVIQRGEGEVRLFVVGHYWSCRLALENNLQFSGIPSFFQSILMEKSNYRNLKCLSSNRSYRPTTWSSIEKYELASCLISKISEDPVYLVNCILRLAQSKISVPIQLPSIENIPREADALGVLLAKKSLENISQPGIIFTSSLGEILKTMNDVVYQSFKMASSEILTSVVNGTNRDDLFLLLKLDGPNIGDLAKNISTLSSIYQVLNLLQSNSIDDALERSRELSASASDGCFASRDAINILHSFSSAFSEMHNDLESPALGLHISRVSGLLSKLQEKLTVLQQSEVFRETLENLTSQIERMRHRLKDQLTVYAKFEGELKQNDYRSISVKLRGLGVQIARVAIKAVGPSNCTIKEPEIFARPDDLRDFIGTFDVMTETPLPVFIEFHITYFTTDGEDNHFTTTKQFQTDPSPENTLNKKWDPINYRFVYGPIVDDTRFIGRSSLVDNVVDKISTTPQPIAITGEWRIGKSSFVKKVAVQLLAKKNFGICELDLQTIQPSNVSVFVENLLRGALDSLKTLKMATAPSATNKIIDGTIKAFESFRGINIPGGFGIEINKKDPISQTIERVKAAFLYLDRELAKNNETMVIIIDEINHISKYDSPEILLSFLRGLIQKLNNFKFVVIAKDIFGTLRKYEVPFFNIFEKIAIKGLTKSETRRLLLLADDKIQCSDSILTTLQSETGGNPYWLCAVFDRVINRLNKKKSYFVTESDVIDSLEEALEDQSEIFLRSWSDATLDNKSEIAANILFAIANEGGKIEKSKLELRSIKKSISNAELSEHLDRLIDKGYIFQHGRILSISNKLFSNWIIKRKL